jgi:hypothetical protein
MAISTFFITFYAGDGIPLAAAMVCDDDLATITTEGYLDSSYVFNSVVPYNGDLIQTRYGDGTLSCLFATTVNAESGSITLVPIAGVNMT